jgi:hypothetical protein
VNHAPPPAQPSNAITALGTDATLSDDGRAIIILGRVVVGEGLVVIGAQVAIPADQVPAFIAKLRHLETQLRRVVLPGPAH